MEEYQEAVKNRGSIIVSRDFKAKLSTSDLNNKLKYIQTTPIDIKEDTHEEKLKTVKSNIHLNVIIKILKLKFRFFLIDKHEH